MKIRKQGSSTGKDRSFVNMLVGHVHMRVYHAIYEEMIKITNEWFHWLLLKMREPKSGEIRPLPKNINSPYGYRGRVYDRAVSFHRSGYAMAANKVRFVSQGYVASAEGEYPATVTGNFLENLKFNLGTKSKNQNWAAKNSVIRVTITSGAEYTEYLIESGRFLIEESKEDFWMLAKERLKALKGGNKKLK